jgi:hypothetical protein
MGDVCYAAQSMKLCRCDRPMVEQKEGFAVKRQFGVRSSLVIAELNLEHALIEPLDHCADLTANKPMLGHVDEQSNHIENVDGGRGRHGRNLRGDSRWSIAGSLRRSAQSTPTELPQSPSARRPLSLG